MTRATTRLIAGAMSGTSADGVDVAIVQISGRGLGMSARLVHHHHRPYDGLTKHAIASMRREGRCDLRDLATLGQDVSLAYAMAVNEALLACQVDADQVACIAAHGQTLFHDPPMTIQWFNPSLVAHETGCPVVSDFRRADCAAGGQGAPLVAYADYILFRDESNTRVLLNLGGIANITYLRAGGTLGELIAFDTGPGNCISDFLVRSDDPGGLGVDVDGAIALTGSANDSCVYDILSNSYFQSDPPKTTDVPSMIEMFQRATRECSSMSLADSLATACLLTAKCVAEAIRSFVPIGVDELIVSGGGVHNAAIIRDLNAQLPDVRVQITDALGWPSGAKEAVAFAMMGAATLDGEPSNVPSATGAKRAVVLGSITPRP